MTTRNPDPRDVGTPSAASRAAPGPVRSTPWNRSVPLLVAGGVAVVAGGAAAAVTGPAQWSNGSWVAAFLVLVAGVAQLGIGAGQAGLSVTTPTVAFVAAQCGMWNIGCATVIAGTLLSSPVVVSAGSAPLVAVLVMSGVAVRGRPRTEHAAVLGAYRLLLFVVLASVPIGVALAFARR